MLGAFEEQTFLFGTRFSKPLSGANKNATSDLGVVGGGVVGGGVEALKRIG